MTVPVPQRFLIFCLVILSLLPAASAFSVSSVTSDPAGTPVPNAAITVTVDIPCRDVGVYDQIVLSTDLIEPVWDARTVIKDKQSPIISAFANGKTLTIPGAAFTIERGTSGSVRIVLKGFVPDTPTPGQDIVRIRQRDAEGIEYAHPSGYYLPMAAPVIPETTLSTIITQQPAADDSSSGDRIDARQTPPSFGELVGAEPTDRSFGDLVGATTSGTPVPSRKSTLVIPTPWTGDPQTPAAPADPLVALAAVGFILYMIRR